MQVTKLFAERLQAWKHAVGYLEDYITATEKTNHAHGKEYERVWHGGAPLCTPRTHILMQNRQSKTR